MKGYTVEDTAIVGLFFSRSEEAITATQTKYGHYLGTISFNILRNTEDSEECVNDTYLRAWNAIPPAKPVSLKAYLAKIVRNLSLNRLESLNAGKRGGNSTDTAFEELEECISDRFSVEEEVEGKLLSESIDRFLGTLSEKYRIVFVQRYFYLYSVEEIAELNGYTVSNVKSLLFRARNRLREYLSEEGFSL